MSEIEQIQINFSPDALRVVNILIGFVMFGVALDLKLEDFKQVFRKPKAPIVGLISQFFILPFMAYILVKFFQPSPGLALGVVIISACPGGNLSNFLTNFARGNTALSISMSTVSTLLAIFMTPINISFWGGLHPEVAAILNQVNLDFVEILKTVTIILICPTIAGVSFAKAFPRLSEKLKSVFLIGSFVMFVGLIGGAFSQNMNYFLQYFEHFLGIVVATNIIALAIGIVMGKLTKLGDKDIIAITFEIGIQNAAFGLVIVFNFFNQSGGAAIICAFWGVWHIISGISLASFWSFQNKRVLQHAST